MGVPTGRVERCTRHSEHSSIVPTAPETNTRSVEVDPRTFHGNLFQYSRDRMSPVYSHARWCSFCRRNCFNLFPCEKLLGRPRGGRRLTYRADLEGEMGCFDFDIELIILGGFTVELYRLLGIAAFSLHIA